MISSNDKQTPKAIVVGASSGIGKEVALLLADNGWKVGIAGRRTELMKAIADTSDGIVAYRQIDVIDPDAPAQLCELIKELGGMDLYFHSSGIGWQNVALDTEKEILTVETNALGFTRMVNAAFNFFASTREGGHIAAITSIAGTKGLGAAPAYSSTKRFQRHYLECLSQLATIRHLPVSITDIRPGFVHTDLIAGSNFPLQLSARYVAEKILKAIRTRKSVVTIDWRYRLLVSLWNLLPRSLWVRMKVK